MSSATLSPPLKWHGGKGYLADRIIALMPPHVHYVEPFAGGLAVLLAKNPAGVSEVVNDINGWLTNFWSVLRDPVHFEHFQRYMQATPFAEAVFLEAREIIDNVKIDTLDPVMAAAWFFVCCRQSMSGRMESFAPLSRNRVRRGMNEQSSAWLTSIEGLLPVHQRLRPVVIFNKPAVEVIRQQDGENTFFYLDPPYPKNTRTAPEVYAHEMTSLDHQELLTTIKQCAGKVMISSYDCELYNDELAAWRRVEFDLPNNAASGTTKRRMTEVIWCNF